MTEKHNKSLGHFQFSPVLASVTATAFVASTNRPAGVRNLGNFDGNQYSRE